MKIAFIGCVDFSERVLSHILSKRTADVCCIVTRKSSPYNADFRDLSAIADHAKIPYFYAEKNNQSEISLFVGKYNPDVIFCFGWSYLLGREILELPRMGVVGYHPAKLPANRGRHPLIWALTLGLNETGSTFFWMDEGADSGPILNQSLVPIDESDDATILYSKVVDAALKQVDVFLTDLLKGRIVKIEQDHSKANYWRKRGRLDGQIDFRMTSKTIHNLVRALTRPYVGAHIQTKLGDIKIWKARVRSDIHTPNIEPGKVLATTSTSILVKTSDSAIEILEHDFVQNPRAGEYL